MRPIIPAFHNWVWRRPEKEMEKMRKDQEDQECIHTHPHLEYTGPMRLTQHTKTVRPQVALEATPRSQGAVLDRQRKPGCPVF
jgi:hypothetical protein